MLTRDQLLDLADLASRAGAVIEEVRARGVVAMKKDDESPVTEADRAAEAVILAGLARLWPDTPVLAEEEASAGMDFAMAARFFLVDPLDGTREFIRGSDDYTVNIALVDDHEVVAGVVYLSATGELYAGARGQGAFKVAVAPGAAVARTQVAPITTRPYPVHGLTVLGSYRGEPQETTAFLEPLTVAARIVAGSSLKFCRIAEGAADLYPRFGPTMEWDTAAGQAVLEAAGGIMTQPDGAPFTYGKVASGFLNGPFVAWGGAPATTA